MSDCDKRMATVWVDIDNAPHVPFVAPVVRGLRDRGHRSLVTLRDFGYTREMALQRGLDHRVIGRHWGRSKLLKVGALGSRVTRLALWALGQNIDVAFSHGCRAQAIAARSLGIPTVSMFDYEYVSTSVFNRFPTKLLLPERLPDSRLRELGFAGDRIVRYPGLKEQLYLGDLEPDPSFRDTLYVEENRILAVLRPPATSAHYHDATSEAVFEAVLRAVEDAEDVIGIIVPRTPAQAAEIANLLDKPLKFRILEQPVDGLNLIWNSDLVVGGGGTMNREAAMLGVPVYSTFTGKLGAVDQSLVEEGRMILVRSPGDIGRILFARRSSYNGLEALADCKQKSRDLLDFFLEQILPTSFLPG